MKLGKRNYNFPFIVQDEMNFPHIVNMRRLVNMRDISKNEIKLAIQDFDPNKAS